MLIQTNNWNKYHSRIALVFLLVQTNILSTIARVCVPGTLKSTGNILVGVLLASPLGRPVP